MRYSRFLNLISILQFVTGHNYNMKLPQTFYSLDTGKKDENRIAIKKKLKKKHFIQLQMWQI